MDYVNCWYCDKTIEFKDEDVIISCDTVEGQYIEYEAVLCPFCGVTVEIGYNTI